MADGAPELLIAANDFCLFVRVDHDLWVGFDVLELGSDCLLLGSERFDDFLSGSLKVLLDEGEAQDKEYFEVDRR